MSAPARPAARLAPPICAGVLAVFNLTCAHPGASGSAAAGAPAAATTAAAADDDALASLPPRPKTIPTTDHTELRTLGKTIARHVERGFETLVVSTGEDVRCEGERMDTGAEVRIQGASDPRRPWSAWFSSLPIGNADSNGGGANGFLVIRRPLPARGERQIAHLY